jgi:hypothetical protein
MSRARGQSKEAKTTMKKSSPNEKEAETGEMLRLAEKNLERVLRELDATIGDLEARGEGAQGRAKAVTTDVRKAIQTVFDERHRIEKLDEKNGDTGAGEGFDLDAARAEIGRRLARLRERSAAGEVSGQPDG